MEQLGYIKGLDGWPIYSAYHEATGAPTGRAWPVVIAPPLFEERKSAFGPLRRLALKLAGAGHPVLRFDYRGSGESGMIPGSRRWKHLAEDVATARRTLSSLSGKRDSVLLGLRMGATVALQETIRVGGEAVIALAPIVRGSAQVRLWKMRSKIRAEMTQPQSEVPPVLTPTRTVDGMAVPGALDFDGYEVDPEFFNDVSAIDLVKDLGKLSCPGLLLQISHRTDAAPETTELMNVLGSRGKLDCLRMEPFWDKLDDVDTAPLDERVLGFLNEL